MRHFILPALLAAVAFVAAPLYGAEEATNKVCFCGKPVAPGKSVAVTIGDKSYNLGVCCDNCAAKAKADPKMALEGTEVKNKKDGK